MYKHLLIASDGSELAGKALTHGLELAQSLGARVTVLTASAPFPMPGYGTVPAATLIEAYEKATTENAERILSAAGEAAKKLGVICETIHARAREPAEVIVDTAQSKACDLIVMASHGYHAVKRLLLGSVAIEVLAHSKVPVLIFRNQTT
ncbi:MAG: universal stress protein [Rhodospirillales bacterium]|nr:universal stress protein [Rhodospirillales bacterium]